MVKAVAEPTQVQGRGPGPLPTRRHAQELAAFFNLPKDRREYSLNTFRLLSVCTKYFDISKETLYISLTWTRPSIFLLDVIVVFFPLLGPSTASQDLLTGSHII